MKVFIIGTELHSGNEKVGDITPTNFRFKSEAWLNGNGVTVHTITGSIEHYDVISGKPSLTEGGIAVQLNKAKGACKTLILTFADDLRKSLAKNPTYMEVAGWPLKLALAEKYQSGVELTDAEKLRLNIEIEFRNKGETIDSLTNKVIVQSNGLALSVSVIDGMQSSAMRACEASSSVDELTALCENLKIEASAQLSKLKGI
tara:strand:- start:3943 stop:4548 length:606 start_codon:yes stop_codon:yes gene_type:complete